MGKSIAQFLDHSINVHVAHWWVAEILKLLINIVLGTIRNLGVQTKQGKIGLWSPVHTETASVINLCRLAPIINKPIHEGWTLFTITAMVIYAAVSSRAEIARRHPPRCITNAWHAHCEFRLCLNSFHPHSIFPVYLLYILKIDF